MKKNMRFILFLFILLSTALYIYINTNKDYKIHKVLNTKYYSYLPKQAKQYVEDVYNDTGDIIYTEKNKKDNMPYLNPKYVKYLSLSKEEQSKVEEIPNIYLIDYTNSNVESNDSLPSTYDLRNVNGNTFVTPQKNQRTLDICWAFTTIEQVESNLLVKNNESYSNSFPILSTRQLDYANSTDGINDYENVDGSRELGSGGNFLNASFAFSNGVGLVSESSFPFTEDKNKKELYEVFNYNNSLYEMNNSIYMPTITSSTTPEEKENYIADLKNFIKEYGGAYVGTQAPSYSCSHLDSNNNYLIRVDDGCEENAGHAMQIIGWDDNYSYSYCKVNNAHNRNTSNCSSENLVSGTGAWLLRNSWGTNKAYAYLAYESLGDDIYISTDVTSMSNKNWDNNYHKPFNPFYFYYGSSDIQSFEKESTSPEKVEKVKFFAFGQNGTYKLSINTGSHNYTNIKQVTVSYPGLYTIDLSDQNIILNNETFKVTVSTSNRIPLLKNTVAVFTSNQSQEVEIKSTTNEINLYDLEEAYSFRLYSKTKNIPSGERITYELTNKTDEVVNQYLTVSNNIVATNNINTTITISSNIEPGEYTLKLKYQDSAEEISLVVGNTSHKIIYDIGEGAIEQKIQEIADPSKSFQLEPNTFSKTGYMFVEWNTQPDGTGVTYSDGQELSGLSEDLTLYAQWRPIHYTIIYNRNTGNGNMNTQTLNYDQEEELLENSFTKEDYKFVEWNTQPDGTGVSYSNKEKILNLTENENDSITLYAIWQEDVIVADSITLDKTKIYLTEGNSEVLTATINPSNTTNKNVTWSSSDSNVATIEENGTVNAIKEGTAIITAKTNNDKTTTCQVIVTKEEVEVTGISLNKTIISLKEGNNETLIATITPENATNKNITWTSSNPNIATVINGTVTGVGTGITTIIVKAGNKTATCQVTVIPKEELKISYKTHVQSYGWQEYVSNGEMSGTEGEAKRLEGIKIKLENSPYEGEVLYKTHIQSIGWEEEFKKNNDLSGTEGRALRLEAIQIKLDGEISNHYDVYYRVHAQKFGWLGWAKNGESAGTAAFAYRLEGIQIRLVPKDEEFSEYGKKKAFEEKLVQYTTHVQSYGWQEYTYDGNMSGTSGEAKRLEAIKILLSTTKYTGAVEYKTHIQSYGWEKTWKRNNEISGTSGEAKRLEAIQIRLTGEISNHYDIYYRVHAQSFGWLGWAKNGAKSGTAGYAKRLEGIEIILVEKGQNPPVRYNQNINSAYLEK